MCGHWSENLWHHYAKELPFSIECNLLLKERDTAYTWACPTMKNFSQLMYNTGMLTNHTSIHHPPSLPTKKEIWSPFNVSQHPMQNIPLSSTHTSTEWNVYLQPNYMKYYGFPFHIASLIPRPPPILFFFAFIKLTFELSSYIMATPFLHPFLHSHDEWDLAFSIFHFSSASMYYCECKWKIKMGEACERLNSRHNSYNKVSKIHWCTSFWREDISILYSIDVSNCT